MENINTATLVFIILGALALILFFIWKNQRDRKTLNPDAADSVTEEKNEKENDRDRI